MDDKKSLYASISASAASMTLSFFLHSPWSNPNIYSDIGSFWGSGWGVSQGLIPFFQVFFPYPPISGYLVYLARIIGGNYDGYFTAFGIMSILAAIPMAWSCWRITKRLGSRLNPLYFLLPSLIVYGVYNTDFFHALLIVLSLQMFLEGRKTLSSVALGLAVATKLVSGVLLPIYLLELTTFKERTKYLGVMIAVLAFFYVPIALLNFNSLYQFYVLFRGWGLEDAWYIWIFQNPFSQYAKLFGLVVTAVLLIRVYTLKTSLVNRVFLGLAAYLIGAYIYAPQFNLILIPIVIVLGFDNGSLYFWEIFNALIILTWFLVPDPTYPGTLPQTMALVRTFSLVVMCTALLRESGIGISEFFRISLRPTIARLKHLNRVPGGSVSS